jgi:hypothetical protein
MKYLLIALLGCQVISLYLVTGCTTDDGKDDVDSGSDTDTDTDTDSDTDADASTDSDTDTDTDTDADSTMTDCVGGKYDPDSNLCWQDPPSDTLMNWYVAAGVEHETDNPAPADDYCGDLVGGWRLPKIEEIRSLFRSGEDKECEPIEWDMDWTEAPTGYCELADGCLSYDCRDAGLCGANLCGDVEGPGVDGCFWNAGLSGPCIDRFWSLSEYADDSLYGWGIGFQFGYVQKYPKSMTTYVRCVRTGP